MVRVVARSAPRDAAPQALAGPQLGLGRLERRRPAGPGAIVVWRHHVGIITGRHGNQWVVKSGNDGRRVRERPRSVAGAIAFRRV
jgi:hypothetical protein